MKKLTKKQVRKTLIIGGAATCLVGIGWFLGSNFSDAASSIKNGIWGFDYDSNNKTWGMYCFRNMKRAQKWKPSRIAYTKSPEVLEALIKNASEGLKAMKGEE